MTRPRPLKPPHSSGRSKDQNAERGSPSAPPKPGASKGFSPKGYPPKGQQARRRPDKGVARAAIESDEGPHWLWGVHPCLAALANPDRTVLRVAATRNAGARLPAGLAHEVLEAEAMDALLPAGAVHQGLAVRVEPLPDWTIEEACAPLDLRPVLVLDQVTDPQNVGALFRAGAAFGARAIIMQDRKSPPLTGVLAKAAAGALEVVAPVRVVNIARSLEALGDLGYLTVGLEGEATMPLEEALADARPIALALGAEGKGLRDLVASMCERRARIPISPIMESLNVATAGAVALYEAARTRPLKP